MVSFSQATLALLGLAVAASAAPAAVAAPFRPASAERRDLEPRRAKIVPKVMIVSLVSLPFFTLSKAPPCSALGVGGSRLGRGSV